MNHPAALTLAQELEMDRARIAAAMDRIYRNAGFAAAVSIHQGVMRSLVEQAKADGAEMSGWVA